MTQNWVGTSTSPPGDWRFFSCASSVQAEEVVSGGLLLFAENDPCISPVDAPLVFIGKEAKPFNRLTQMGNVVAAKVASLLKGGLVGHLRHSSWNTGSIPEPHPATNGDIPVQRSENSRVCHLYHNSRHPSSRGLFLRGHSGVACSEPPMQPRLARSVALIPSASTILASARFIRA